MRSITNYHVLYLARAGVAESTAELKNRALRYFIKFFGDLPVDEVKYSHAQDFKVMLAKGRTKCSANIYLSNFKPFFSWLFVNGYISANPFGNLSLYSVSQPIKTTYNKDEIERMLTIADARWQVIILLALSSLRRGEILNLHVRDIFFDKGYIQVNAKKDTVTSWCWDIKDHQQALTPLPEYIELSERYELHNLLIRLIEDLPPKQPYVILKPQIYQRRMQQKAEGRLTYELRNNPWGNFNRAFQRLLSRAGVKPKKFHALRTTFANFCIQSGKSLEETKNLMRHSAVQTTERYYVDVNNHKLVADTAEKMKKFYVTCVP